MSWPEALMIVASRHYLTWCQRVQNNEAYPLLSLTKARAALNRKGARLMITPTTEGDEFFVVPGDGSRGGRISRSTAHRIMTPALTERIDDDGLYPTRQQSWRIVGT